MKRLKQIAIFVLCMFIFNVVFPNVTSFAETTNDSTVISEELSVTSEDNNSEKNNIQTETVNNENELLGKEDELEKTEDSINVVEDIENNEEVNYDLDTESIDDVDDNMRDSYTPFSTSEEQSTIIAKVENPVMDHKLTDSFQVRGYAISKDGISKVEVYLDNNKVGTATYGIERSDIGTKYPDYSNSNKSGFKYNFTNVSNGKHEVKISVIDSKGNKSDTVISVNINDSKTKIMGTGSLDRAQMINILRRNNSKLDLKYIVDFVDFTIKESQIEGINHDIVFSQMMHETGYLKFGGDVKFEQNNFAGIGATGNGNPGYTFESVEIGIRVVVQHLKAYASTEPLKQDVVDPRFKYVTRGSALYLEHLGIPENPEGYGWATAKGYGYNILNIVSEAGKESKTLNFSVLNDVTISGNQSTGSKITVTATATPSDNTLYRIWVCNRDTEEWTLLSDWSTKRTADFYPEKSGNYSFVVHVKNKNSDTSTQDHYINKDFKVDVGSSKVTSLNVTGNKFVNDTLTMTAAADPSSGTLYKLWVCDRSTDTWTVLSDWSTKNTATFTPKKAGTYSFVVHVKHKNSKTNTQDDYKSVDIKVAESKSTAKSLTVTGDKYVGANLTMTATADPSSETLYKLWVCDRSTDTWTVLSDWSTKNTATFTPKKAGTYSFVVHVKHKNSATKTQDDYKSVDVNVKVAKSIVSSLSVTGNKFVNDTLTMTATADPSSETLYKLWVCDRSTDTWTVLSDWSTKSTVNFVPKKAGTYSFVVHVKHKNSTTNTQDDYKSVDIKVTDSKSTAKSLNVTGDKYVGASLTMTATADPSSETLYKLWVCDRSTDTWTVLSDWSTKSTVNFLPKKAGTYSFVVHVKHKNSTTNTQDDYKSVDIKVADSKSTAKSLTVTGDKYVGANLTMTATADPSSETLYKLWVCDRSTDTWTVLSDWSTKNTATFTPKKAGTYSFVVHVKHKNSSTTSQDSYKSIDINIQYKKSTVKTLDLSGSNIIGQPITMTATADPSSGTLYKLWVCDRSTDTWTVLSDWSTKNTATFTPKKKGYYSFVVHVKNKYSNSSVQEDYMSKDIYAYEKDKATAISLNVSGSYTPNGRISIEALAEPQDDALYKIWVCDRKTETWTVLSDYSKTRTATFTPKTSGTYSIVVHVKHKNSKSERDDYISKDINVTSSKKLIVIDPGHNYGGDSGALYVHNGVTYNETVLNMEVALKLKQELVSRGFEVVMTREESDRDNKPVKESLAERVKIANDLNADLFVSIHHNSNPNSLANGVEVYYSSAEPLAGTNNIQNGLTSKINTSKLLAQNMVNNIASQLGYYNRGAKDEEFYVVKNTFMPSVLVECGFISNPTEAQKLANQDNQLKFAKVLADQIQKQF
ncbi:N-acetylmuramoyl-L-alanine amidase [Clostridium nigeriense]|uniref:N-acetylmuramoyl-L-alanine amidase n=1 Tax=Clostridium nigeriense TaxID=1805470 RepID=UPI003D356069